MTVSAGTLHMKMSCRRGKSPGWAAFDLKQQEKDGLVPEGDTEPYPPLSSTVAPLQTCQNLEKKNDLSVKSFSSVLLPSKNFPTLVDYQDSKKQVPISISSGKHCDNVILENRVVAIKKLKELHCWADKSLIEDIMEAVHSDFDKASSLLNAMFSEENNGIVKELSNCEDFHSDITSPADKGGSSRGSPNLAELSHAHEGWLNDKSKQQLDAFSGEMHSVDAECMRLISQHLSSIPIEPEWEEDDVYLIHRKEALRMMRSASHHSRAATDAYLRGDHFSAQQLSRKAREEWLSAEKLNDKAAKEILSIRNCKNDIWTFDLHGLHAAEAVQALQEHLQKIESQLPLSHSVSPNKKNVKAGIIRSASLESFSCIDAGKSFDTQQATSRLRPTSLQVITGKGNHSRGQAALPAAVRSFLNENGYRYEEARAGVVMVRPKFRHQ